MICTPAPVFQKKRPDALDIRKLVIKDEKKERVEKIEQKILEEVQSPSKLKKTLQQVEETLKKEEEFDMSPAKTSNSLNSGLRIKKAKLSKMHMMKLAESQSTSSYNSP